MRYQILNNLNSLQVSILGKRLPAFQVCGLFGLALATGLAFVLARCRGLSLAVVVCIVMAAVATFIVLVMATKIVTGQENIIYYHHEIAVTLAAAALLWLIHKPILPYMDITILGIGVFLAFGRIGCFMVGCCHGRPHAWGVCYRQEHADAGFTPYLVGVRLFPVQLLESLMVFVIVVVAAAAVLGGGPPGLGLAVYTIAYSPARFIVEFLRGDAERPYYLGFSQPQWISLGMMAALPLVGYLGYPSQTRLYLLCALMMAFTVAAIGCARRRRTDDTYRLLHPRHMREIAQALHSATRDICEVAWPGWTVMPTRGAPGRRIKVAGTSLGIRISAGYTWSPNGYLYHYTISRRPATLQRKAAYRLARLIAQLRMHNNGDKVVDGGSGVFHLVVEPAPQEILN